MASPERRVELMDTTLRDGEQTPEVSYAPLEKLQIARMLLREVGVDRIEAAQTRVSEGERQAARRICTWARKSGLLSRIEIMGYCDGTTSADWIAGVGGKVMNLLAKGSERHCRGQLGVSPEVHRARVHDTLQAARRRQLRANVYLEDWSNGVRESFNYVFAMVQELRAFGVDHVYLADTLGVLAPKDVTRYVGLMTASWPDVHFEFHAHNDYGLAAANVLAAVEAGARGIHTSVNGMGERAGNTRLAEAVAVLHDQSEHRTRVDESRLAAASRMVETLSGKAVAPNAPLVGRDVFTQTGGIHADGDAKGDLYANRLVPERFGRKRRYALGKLSGKASLDQNLKAMGIELSAESRELVLRRIVELGDKKHTVVPADLPYVIADVLKTPAAQAVQVESYEVVVGSSALPSAQVAVRVGPRRAKASASGDGGYDALMNALKKAVKGFGIRVPRLVDFRVRIPPGGRTGALVETLITWEGGRRGAGNFTTLGVDTDQLAAAVIATERMLNVVVPPPRRTSSGKTRRRAGSPR